MQEYQPEFRLISEAELREIRRLWLTERHDWEDSLPQIYHQATGQQLDWEFNDVSLPGKLELELLQEVAAKHETPVKLLQKLIDAEWQCRTVPRDSGAGLRQRATAQFDKD